MTPEEYSFEEVFKNVEIKVVSDASRAKCLLDRMLHNGDNAEKVKVGKLYSRNKINVSVSTLTLSPTICHTGNDFAYHGQSYDLYVIMGDMKDTKLQLDGDIYTYECNREHLHLMCRSISNDPLSVRNILVSQMYVTLRSIFCTVLGKTQCVLCTVSPFLLS